MRVLSDFDIGAIKQALKQRKGNVAAAALDTGHDRRTIRAYVDRNFRPLDRTRSTHPRIAQRRLMLVRLAKMTCRKEGRVWPKFGSASQLRAALWDRTQELLSVRHIQRELHAAGFKAYVRVKVPTRKACELLNRRRFCAEMRSWSMARRKAIVFSDESWLSACERTGRVMWARCRDDVLPLEKKARWNVASVMVWAAVGVGYKSEIVVLPSKKSVDGELRVYRLDSADYIRRCLSTVVAGLNRQRRVFQQDGARSHVSKQTMAYLERKRVEIIRNWPAYSPDYNMIEIVWKELHRRVGIRCPMNTEELITCIKEEWRAMDQSLIDKICQHFTTVVRKG